MPRLPEFPIEFNFDSLLSSKLCGTLFARLEAPARRWAAESYVRIAQALRQARDTYAYRRFLMTKRIWRYEIDGQAVAWFYGLNAAWKGEFKFQLHVWAMPPDQLEKRYEVFLAEQRRDQDPSEAFTLIED